MAVSEDLASRAEPSGDADLMAVGSHCCFPECHQLDFLPFPCSGCSQVFCGSHRTASAHQCSHPSEDANSLIVCPVCAKGIRLGPGEDPNLAFERHSSQCDPANYAKVHKKPRCPVKGCREKLTTINSLACRDCGATVCLKHRLGPDHTCPGRPAAAAKAASMRSTFGSMFGGSNAAATAAATKTSQTGTGRASFGASAASITAKATARMAAAAKQASARLQAPAPPAAAPVPSVEICPQCGARFVAVQALIDHAALAHADGWTSGTAVEVRPPGAAAADRVERCPHCAKEFEDSVALVAHFESAHAALMRKIKNGPKEDSCVVS